MNFKFRILDLFVITTWVASMVGAFQSDLILFRQLLCISLVAACSTASVLFFPSTNYKFQIISGMGGLFGGIIYLVIAYFFAQQLYEPTMFWVRRGIPTWINDVPVAILLSVLVGATIGPLLALRFQDTKITDEFKRPFWFSIILLSGVFLLGIFAMFDRRTMHTRDWLVVSLVLLIVFVINTNDWLNRFQSRNATHSNTNGK